MELLAGIFPFAVVALIGGAAIAYIWWGSKRKIEIIKRWEAANGCRVIDREERSLMRGPYFLRAGKGQAVFRVTVEFPDGQIAKGWIRCGSWALGLLSNEVEVKWDEEMPQPPGFPVVLLPEATPAPHEEDRAFSPSPGTPGEGRGGGS